MLPEEEQIAIGQAQEEPDRPFALILNQRLAVLQGSKDYAQPLFPTTWGRIHHSGCSGEAGTSVGSGVQDGFVLKISG